MATSLRAKGRWMPRCSESVMVTLFPSKLSLCASPPPGSQSSVTKKFAWLLQALKNRRQKASRKDDQLVPLCLGLFLVLALRVPHSGKILQFWVDHMVGHLTFGSLLSPSQGGKRERSVSIWTSSPVGAVSCKKYSGHISRVSVLSGIIL